ncbi:hypothetical protein AA23498_2093 [Acetobacter nitrogenifigens DSM 23921 = NBRC 105050]|nr:hypothetical protein AA23498_2093 [Acetobacter nitrogenifigens DSM 23921 = NBRC 105050]
MERLFSSCTADCITGEMAEVNESWTKASAMELYQARNTSAAKVTGWRGRNMLCLGDDCGIDPDGDYYYHPCRRYNIMYYPSFDFR